MLSRGGVGGGSGGASSRGEAPAGPPPIPPTLVCSGLLPTELDEVAAAFAKAGLTEDERRTKAIGRGCCCAEAEGFSAVGGICFRAMLATIVDPGYKIALFLHILAVVLAFGPTFGYALFFSVVAAIPARRRRRSSPGCRRCDRYLVNPG